MGNKITYHSPSRGSSMEMGAAITILIFSQYKVCFPDLLTQPEHSLIKHLAPRFH
jgi:hypothetical protein